jgi:3-hydroxyisobutyrate dehydrogenase-like beta-hydroxyacid dehydrogenase
MDRQAHQHDRLRVGFLGLGRMGRPMAANVIRAGFPTLLYNRTRAIAEELARETDALVAETPADAASRCDVVVTMLADPEAVLAVYEGPEGVLQGLTSGAIAIDMGTTGPDVVLTLAEFAAAEGAGFVDAPVSGSVAFAESGSLTIMAGGKDSDVERVTPILQAIGSPIVHVGRVGAGATMKLAVNAVVYGLCQALSEGLVLAERAGVERAKAYEVFAASAVAAPFVHYRREEFEHPGLPPVAFRLALAKKDMDLILSLAARSGTVTPQAEINRSTLREAMEAGWSDHDVAAVAEYLRQASNGAREG